MNTTTPSGDSVIIGIGEYYVGSKTMTSIGLGSCVGLVLHDVEKSTGALVHIMLPSSQGKTDRPGKYADTAVAILLTELARNGSSQSKLIAKMVGGAAMFKTFSGNLNIGDRNVEVVRQLLQQNKIPLKGEETGGNVGRTIFYYPGERGKVIVRKGDGAVVEL